MPAYRLDCGLGSWEDLGRGRVLPEGPVESGRPRDGGGEGLTGKTGLGECCPGVRVHPGTGGCEWWVRKGREPGQRPRCAEKEIFISDAVSGGMSETAAVKVYEFMAESLLCDNIGFIGQSPVGNALWEISASEFIYNIAADEDGIYSVRCGDYLVFDGDQVLLTTEDLQLRSVSGYETYYAVIAEEIVTSYLKSPSTADFAPIYDFRMKRCGDLVMVSAYVDAQNSFGAMIRNEWLVEFRTIDLENR